MPKLTVADLQHMKDAGQKIAAAVVYDAPMTRVFERAGVDFLSVGDSFASYLFGAAMDEVSVEEILPFAKAVVRAAERAVVSVDVPIGVCEKGPKTVFEAAKRIKDAAAPSIAKLYIPSGPAGLVDLVRAVNEAGLEAYCRVPYPTDPGSKEIRGAPDKDDHVLRVASDVQEAGACLIDLYMGTPEIYGKLANAVRIPVIGGQWSTPESDGKIFVYPNVVGYRAVDIERPGTVAKLMYDMLAPELAKVHAAAW